MKIGVQPKERAASGAKHKYACPVDRLDWLDGAGFDWRCSSRRAIYFTKHLCTQILFCHSEAFNSLFFFFSFGLGLAACRTAMSVFGCVC